MHAMTSASPRRWLRFSLRTMFVLVTAVALWLGWELNIVRQRRAALDELGNNQAVHVFTDIQLDTSEGRVGVPKLRMLLGDQPVALIRFDAGQPESELSRVKELFPESDVGYRASPYPVDGSPTVPSVVPVR
jgi:hypothetical protein